MTRGTVKVGSAGRFSTRYGVKTRTQIAAIEKKQKALHQCPRCGQLRVKRIGTSIWKCRRCACIFAGGAYMPKAAPKQSLGGEKVEAAAAEKKAGEAKAAKKAPKKEKKDKDDEAPEAEAPRAKAPKAKEAVKAKEAPDQPEKPASPAGEAPKKLKKKVKEEI
jgi:large subunit ribosomal protein L37Ae